MTEIDPTFVCSAYKKPRFYLFTQREPLDPEEQAKAGESIGRDVFNEKTGKDIDAKTGLSLAAKALPDKAILYTTMGEIYL